MKNKILFADGTEYGLIHKLTIQSWMTQYFDMSSTIFYKDEEIHVPFVTSCQLCDRLFTEATKQAQVRCQELKINREFNYVAKICVDCSWYIERARGNVNIPRSIGSALDAGHKPIRFDNLIG